ncbi:MAG: SDR family oxidoreductase [Arcobacteraceae bacterium]
MKVLLTGATGYIGRRLKQKLINDKNIELKLFVRNKKSLSNNLSPETEIIEGDTFDKDKLRLALKDVDVAYYMIHSLNNKNYKDLDKKSAQNFIDIAEECGVKRVIYLGGLGVKNDLTSEHLLSRLETGEVLSSSSLVQTVWIRAGVIIGSGSTSFEIIRHLTEKLPIMTTPKWVYTKAQPIAVDNVLDYLYDSLYLELKENLIVDIGSEELSYRDMMVKTGEVLGLKRLLIPVPFLTISLSSHWLNLFTPVPIIVAHALIEGLKSEVTIQNNNAKKYFPEIKPISFEQSVQKAIDEIKNNQVISRWSDNWGINWDSDDAPEISDAIFVDRKVLSIKGLCKKDIFKSFVSIGGGNGWFAFNFLWEIRGFIDKVIGGVGLQRGRRVENELRIGDSLDFWKVADIKENERLLLLAQMKVPGTAWLEFKIENDTLIQSAYFYPKGVWGRLYWYGIVPLHYFVFNNMIKSIVQNVKNKK